MFVPDLDGIRKHLVFLNRHVRTGCPCHTHGTDLIPDMFEVLRQAESQTVHTDNARLLVSTLDVLAYYRSRVHRAIEDAEGTFGPLHTVYSVHKSAMVKAQELIIAGRQLGLVDLGATE